MPGDVDAERLQQTAARLRANIVKMIAAAGSGHNGGALSAAQCLQAIRPLGRLTQVGHFGRDIAIPYDLVAFRQIRITGSVGYTADSWRRALAILGAGRVKLDGLITHRLPLDQWQPGFDAFEAKSALKVLLQPT